jgi:hypothetical protein
MKARYNSNRISILYNGLNQKLDDPVEIKEEVFQAVFQFFEKSEMFKPVNITSITLVLS